MATETKDNESIHANTEVKLIHQAIQQLLKKNRVDRQKSTGNSLVAADDSDDDDDQMLLSRLLSQLESLKEDNALKPSESPTETKDLPSSAVVKVGVKDEYVNIPSNGSRGMDSEEILEEIKKVRRQNSITHWLLSIMIFLTAAWQLSEVSLILMVKDKLSHPFRSVGNVVTGMIMGRGKNERDAEQNTQTEAPSLPSLKMPELPRVDLPALGLSNED
ncbi:PREDICTED: uncharacterized protein LOC104592862 [Nelumbo nucifera]|uniref:Uncharacterized protein LOC104592862 n=1 Tax=Nelumbo nucifera TaxID=4432 RepID=A0A1U7ZPT7_NELNU|nr:PREDICTED: uncharacterized protein LOC104592862 [Nelumbo nucifera]